MDSPPASGPPDLPWPPAASDLTVWRLPDPRSRISEPLAGLTGTLVTHDGLRLATRRWSAGAARALLVLSHGFGEHSGRYAMLASELAAAGVDVWAYDLRGHGESEGRRGHVPSYEAYLGDLSMVVGAMKAGAPEGLPTFVFGHSMGGGIALNFAIRHGDGLRGVIASAPYLRLAFEPPGWKVALAGWLAGFWPTASFSARIDAALLSHDDREVLAYRTDPRIHDRITAKTFLEIGAAGRDAIERAAELVAPLLLLHGGDDAITDSETSAAFVIAAGALDRTFIRFPGLYHEILNEPEGPEVRAAIVDWLLERI